MADYIDRESLVTDMQKRFCEDCDRRKGEKNGRVRFVYDIGDAPCRACWVDDAIDEIENYPSADVQPIINPYNNHPICPYCGSDLQGVIKDDG